MASFQIVLNAYLVPLVKRWGGGIGLCWKRVTSSSNEICRGEVKMNRGLPVEVMRQPSTVCPSTHSSDTASLPDPQMHCVVAAVEGLRQL